MTTEESPAAVKPPVDKKQAAKSWAAVAIAVGIGAAAQLEQLPKYSFWASVVITLLTRAKGLLGK
jgi:hypothetical protein